MTSPRSPLPVSAFQPFSESILDRHLELNDEDLDRISRLIHQRAGIVLARHKRGMIYGRLSRRLRELGLLRFGDYLDRLEGGMDPGEWETFVNALTTNLTAFYREPHHFDLLAAHLRGRSGPVRIWCCAASTGEEAYTIAITLRQSLGERVTAEVLATDIDTAALERARQGIYAVHDVLKHEARGMTDHFLRGRGGNAHLARVRPELAALVEFAPLNLTAPSWPSVKGPFDAIFCRNVMIYFDKDTQARVLKRFVPLLKPDGLLFAGHSESFSYISDDFRLRGQTVYTLNDEKRLRRR